MGEKKSNLCKTSPAKTIKYCLYVSKIFQKGALKKSQTDFTVYKQKPN